MKVKVLRIELKIRESHKIERAPMEERAIDSIAQNSKYFTNIQKNTLALEHVWVHL